MSILTDDQDVVFYLEVCMTHSCLGIAFISCLLFHLCCFVLFDVQFLHNWFPPSVVNDSLHAKHSTSSSLKQDCDNPSLTTFVGGNRPVDECLGEYRRKNSSDSKSRVPSFSQHSVTSKADDSSSSSSVVSSKNSPTASSRIQDLVSRANNFDSSNYSNNKPPLITSSISNNSTSSNNSSLFCHPLLLQQSPSFLNQVSQSSQHSFLASHHHQLQQQPPSINLYESYFDDSYVGDFSGEVDEDRLQDCEADVLTDVQRNWCSDPDLINPSLFEFTYDSFGPESIVFNNQLSNNEDHINEGHRRKESDEIRPSEQDIKTTTANNQASVSHLHPLSTSVDDSEALLMSLSITEPQLRQKLNNCFDNHKIANGYGITSFVKEEDEEQDYDNHGKHSNHELNHHISATNLSKSRGSSKSEAKSVTDCEEANYYDEGKRERKSFTSQEVQSRPKPHLKKSSNSLDSTAYDTDSLDKLGDEKVQDHRHNEMLLQQTLDNEIHDAKHGKESSLNRLDDQSTTMTIPSTEGVNNSVVSSNLEGDDPMILSSMPSSSSSSVVSTASQPSCSSPPLSYSSSTTSSERDASSAFASRNSTLTKSQRRKVSPRLNFSQILSVSDDTAKVLLQNDTVNDLQEPETRNGNETLSNLTGREVILSPADITGLLNHNNHHHNHLLLGGHHLHNVLLDSETASSSDGSDFLSRVSTPNTEG